MKKDSEQKHIIVDLSFPSSKSVNSGILKGYYQGFAWTFKLPGVLDVAKQLTLLRKGSFMWSVDLVYNYNSGARTWVLLNSGYIKAFDLYYVCLIKKGVARSKKHLPGQASPLKVEDIKNIVKWFYRLGQIGLVLTAATLIGFYTFLYQCNLLFSMSERFSEHGLKDVDITCTEKALLFECAHPRRNARHLGMWSACLGSDSKYCSVRVWRRYRCPRRPGVHAHGWETLAGNYIAEADTYGS